MSAYNPVPNQPHFGGGYRDLKIRYIVEDPIFRDSSKSLFVQAADVCAFLLYQHICPCSYMRRKAGNDYFRRLEAILA